MNRAGATPTPLRLENVATDDFRRVLRKPSFPSFGLTQEKCPAVVVVARLAKSAVS